MVSKWSQTQKVIYFVITFTWYIQNRQIQKQKADYWLPGYEEGEESLII